MLAHELRNPQAPLLTGLTLLRQAGDDPGIREQTLDMLQRGVMHMKQVVDDLLDVARLGRGKVTLRRQRLDLVQLVRTLVEDHRLLFEQAGLALTVEGPQTPLWVQADETRITQAISNLLDNAAKYTDRGGRVSVHLAVRGGDQAVLSVRDTGIGIPA